MEHLTLYFRQGSSDKVYQANLEPVDGGYVVTFAYGRRGSTLQTGTKTATPVAYAAAKRIYDQLIAEKTAKGYTPGADGTPYQHTVKEARSTGLHCQLLNAINETAAIQLLDDPQWWMQPKHDGRRLLVQKQGHRIIGINRLGLAVDLPAPLEGDALKCPIDFTIDGEAIGDRLHVFDVLFIEREDLRGVRFGERYLGLMNLLGSFQHRNLALVETAMRSQHKAELFQQWKDGGREGVVFKQMAAPYTAGRPNTGGPQLKYKFCETASFIVGKINTQRSVSLLLFHGEKIVAAGNVTIPPNHDMPRPGQLVECRYLYAFRESGCIYQPVYLGPRDDLTSEECTTAQLKYKSEEVAAEPALA